MTTVFVVTHGEYSDYQIEGVFSTEELAKQFMGNAPDGEFGIEEFDLDALPPKVFGTVWHRGICLDGSSIGSGPYNQETAEEFKEHHTQGERGDAWTYEPGRPDVRFVGRSYVSAEHAMKLAVEERQKYLREHPEVAVR